MIYIVDYEDEKSRLEALGWKLLDKPKAGSVDRSLSSLVQERLVRAVQVYVILPLSIVPKMNHEWIWLLLVKSFA